MIFSSESGFSMKSKAPSLVARTAVSIVPWPEIMMTAGGRGCACKRLSASSPSMPGSQTSRRITSMSPCGGAFERFFGGAGGVYVIAFVFENG